MRPNSDCKHAENEKAWLLTRPFELRESEAACFRAVAGRHHSHLFAALNAHLLSNKRVVSPLDRAIEESRGILDLGDNWDGEGSPGYTEDTWQRAVTIVRGLSRAAWDLPVPAIGPAEDGSVDLYWGKPGHDLLLNVPADADSPVAYYGTQGRGEFSGVLDLDEDVSFLTAWLTDLRG